MAGQWRIVPDGVKGRGRRRDADNAEAVMALRCTDQSGLCNSYWAPCGWQNKVTGSEKW